MIILLPIAVFWRVVIAVTWLAVNGRKMSLIARGHKRCRCIRIMERCQIAVMSPHGTWSPATLAAGSIVLSHYAWLRIELDDGLRYGELLRGCCRENQQWRRLQVIWRQL